MIRAPPFPKYSDIGSQRFLMNTSPLTYQRPYVFGHLSAQPIRGPHFPSPSEWFPACFATPPIYPGLSAPPAMSRKAFSSGSIDDGGQANGPKRHFQEQPLQAAARLGTSVWKEDLKMKCLQRVKEQVGLLDLHVANASS